MNRAHNVADNRLRRVINATPFSDGRIIFGKKCFIKVNDRVLALAIAVIIVEYFVDIGDIQNFGNVINDDFQRLGWFFQRDKPENVAQNADGVGNVFESQFAVEGIVRTGSCRKQAVSDGL